MLNINVVGPRDKIPTDALVINVTSHATNSCKLFSPMLLGPVKLPDGRISKTMENAWQFSKVYKEHVDDLELPTEEWYKWSTNGFNQKYASRYPMGKGTKPLYSWSGNEKLDYLTARRELYFPMYRDAVKNTKEWSFFKEQLHKSNAKNIIIFDFDGYDMTKSCSSLADVLNNKDKIMGHGFVFLAMLLHGDNISPAEIDSIYANNSLTV